MEYLARVITKDAPTVRFGNATTFTKLRAGKGRPEFIKLCKAKFWQDEAWDSYQKRFACSRCVAPSTQASQAGILTVNVELAGVERTVAFAKDWNTVEDQTVTCHAVLVVCHKNTAYAVEGLSARMEALSTTNRCVVVIHCQPEVAGHVDTLMSGPSGKGRKAVSIPLTVDPQGRYDEGSDTCSRTTPEGARGDRRSSNRTLRLTVAIMYPKDQIGVNRKFLPSMEYTHGSSMDAVVYVTTVVEHKLHRVLGFPVRRASNADNVQHNLLLLPNYDEPDFPLHVAGAFP